MKRVFVSILLCFCISPAFAVDVAAEMTVRERIQAIAPPAIAAIESFEQEKGKKLTDEELESYVLSEDFAQRLKAQGPFNLNQKPTPAHPDQEQR